MDRSPWALRQLLLWAVTTCAEAALQIVATWLSSHDKHGRNTAYEDLYRWRKAGTERLDIETKVNRSIPWAKPSNSVQTCLNPSQESSRPDISMGTSMISATTQKRVNSQIVANVKQLSYNDFLALPHQCWELPLHRDCRIFWASEASQILFSSQLCSAVVLLRSMQQYNCLDILLHSDKISIYGHIID